MPHFVAKPRVSIGDSGAVSLPGDLLDQARERLSAAAFIYAAAYTLAFVPGLLTMPADFDHPVVVAFGFVFILAAAAFGIAMRQLRPSAAVTLHLALGFQVFGVLGIEYGIPWWLERANAVVPLGLSWSCVWIVIYPVIVPTSLGKASVTAFIAASVRPAMFAIAVARGYPMPDLAGLVDSVLPNYICAGLAIAVAKVVHGWGREVARARQLGSYRLVEQLGQGGMGEVWRAEHRMLARPAAVKLIRPSAIAGLGEGPALVVKRFEREALATATLSSPHTVHLYDFGIGTDGTFYYVMELLQGLDLDDFVKRFGPMPPHRAVFVLRQVCASLAEAHAIGLVHRDIKPANVYLCRAGLSHDFVKVLDFGLVKQAGLAGRDSKLTAANVATGTPAYMAPELALGEDVIDGRADIYALGCVAYYLLTGVQVFDAGSPAKIMFAHVRDTPPRPSTRVEVSVPDELESLVMRCLAKQPTDRPQSADELAGALASAVGGDGWDGDHATKWWRMHLPELAG
jgi:serine/threonine-protein kinase